MNIIAFLKAVWAVFLSFFMALSPAGFPRVPNEKNLEPVWSDEFDHGFDTTIWQGHYVYGEDDTQPRDTAYWNRDQVSFTDDGCLKLTVEYKEDGPAGPAYYSYGIVVHA